LTVNRSEHLAVIVCCVQNAMIYTRLSWSSLYVEFLDHLARTRIQNTQPSALHIEQIILMKQVQSPVRLGRRLVIPKLFSSAHVICTDVALERGE
jgi:hypothetical protein